jgi:hypothetical protein
MHTLDALGREMGFPVLSLARVGDRIRAGLPTREAGEGLGGILGFLPDV